MRQTIIITGANGLLGQKLVNLYSTNKEYDVVVLAKGLNRNSNTERYRYIDVDLTDFDKVSKIMNEVKPEVVINAAAMTNVDECEDKKEACDAINVKLVQELVNLCETHNSYLLHISTDFIFDGKNGPYKEDDEPNPLNYYGLSKLKSEQIIERSTLKYAIIRTILVYGMVDNMNKSNLVLWLKDAIECKKTVTIIDDQYRMPTLVDDLAGACVSSVRERVHGIFNVSSCELLSIYEIALEVARVFNLDISYIKRISTKELNQKAMRPAVTGFDLAKSNEILKLPLVSFTERLQVFKDQLLTN